MASFIPKIFPSSKNPLTKRHTVRRILATPPQHLYNIIIDVDAYRNFLPFCKSSQIIRRSKCGTMFDASMQIGFGANNMFQEEYISRVVTQMQKMYEMDPNSTQWSVSAKSIKSTLFHSLNSSWKLTQVQSKGLGENKNETGTVFEGIKTNVEFEVEINVSNPLISAALDTSLKEVAKQQVAAFEKRCFEIPMSPRL